MIETSFFFFPVRCVGGFLLVFFFFPLTKNGLVLLRFLPSLELLTCKIKPLQLSYM